MIEHLIWKMSRAYLDAQLVAIDRMLEHYSGKKKLEEHEDCPLCITLCEKCLWMIMEEKGCMDMASEVYDDPDLFVEDVRDDLRFIKWRKLRLKQLKKWKRTLKAELERRSEIHTEECVKR